MAAADPGGHVLFMLSVEKKRQKPVDSAQRKRACSGRQGWAVKDRAGDLISAGMRGTKAFSTVTTSADPENLCRQHLKTARITLPGSSSRGQKWNHQRGKALPLKIYSKAKGRWNSGNFASSTKAHAAEMQCCGPGAPRGALWSPLENETL